MTRRAFRSAWAGLAVAAVLASAAIAGGGDRQIRLCADPSNLPFSSREASDPGFEVEIARAIASAMGAELGVQWVPTAREVVAFRQLDERRCDLLMGLPLTERFTADKPRLLFSAPYYVMRQAAVFPSTAAVRSMDDLATRLIGVQAMTLGDHLVYERGYRRKIYIDPAETFAGLLSSEVDAVVIDSPLAGWFAQRNAGFTAMAISDPSREFQIGAALRRADGELKSAVDRAIQQLQSTELPAILQRYGITTAAGMSAQAPPAPPSAAAASPPPLSADLRAARSTYLTQCSQCHGVDAKGTPTAANLRTFKGAEGDFVRVVQNGRPGTAMVPWKGLLSEEDIRNISRYIKQLTSEQQ